MTDLKEATKPETCNTLGGQNERIVMLPCPFCGSAPYFTKSVNGGQMNYLGCSQCGIYFKAMRSDIALDALMTKDIVAAWNKRVAT